MPIATCATRRARPFYAFYGSPLVQAMLGLRASEAPPRPRPGHEPEELALIREQTEALRARMGEGGLREAFIRALIYVRLPQLAADERSFNMLQRLRDEYAKDMTLADFKSKFRDQYMMVLLDPEQAVASLPELLAGRETDAPRALELLREVLAVGGPMIEESRQRLDQVAAIFGAGEAAAPAAEPKPKRRLSVAGSNDAAADPARGSGGGGAPKAAAAALAWQGRARPDDARTDARAQAMSDTPTGTVFSAKDLKRIAAAEGDGEAAGDPGPAPQGGRGGASARQDFMERAVTPEIERFNAWVRRAAEQGQSEIQILRFPSQYCTDHGRAINNFDEDWPRTLTGFAEKVYAAYLEYLKPREYTIRAQILNYPDGGLGEVGLYVGW